MLPRWVLEIPGWLEESVSSQYKILHYREKAYTSAPPDGLTGGVCPIGGYCPIGSAIQQACDPGMYSASLGAKTKYDCVPCDPGFYCAGSSGAEATQECAAGYYCTGGSSVPTQHEVSIGHYSEDGAFKEEPCPRGSYQPATKSSSCLLCQQGYYCNTTGSDNSILCPRGHYCPLGSEVSTGPDNANLLNTNFTFLSYKTFHIKRQTTCAHYVS